ncbi:MAG: tRNA uridine-5-carboxymethylaminomethyl(34) synthesis GTPase MnmE [Prevotellaceae bacterium]|jgi:tRNA modification GTPase|nr:tRNA uridine-5-carboxymethylaminomethyl(34) synthesis GTPase MnmE [Prevotellaceae bacterium]
MIDLASTIAAVATPPGMGGIAVIRLSGAQALAIADKLFTSPSGKKLAEQQAGTVHFGAIVHGGETIDEALVAVFRAPASYTGEDTVEISCHGSPYIQQQILQALVGCGAHPAQPGEFTLRAFLNGKIDLAQAEAVGDLIASETRAMHRVALQQMRGGYSAEIRALREKLLHFASMLELELDFADEDVSFADRQELNNLLQDLLHTTAKLTDSFAVGNAIKKGIPVVIVGSPNVGKSTLLNALLNDEKALVSDVAGTTRDAIEDSATLGGVLFRFIDTAGIRSGAERVEQLGIERSYQKLGQAQIVLLVLDATLAADNLRSVMLHFLPKITEKQSLVALLNKADSVTDAELAEKSACLAQLQPSCRLLAISAKNGAGISALERELLQLAAIPANLDASIVSNLRHYEAFVGARHALLRALSGLNSRLSEELIAFEIREAAQHLAKVTGEIADTDILNNIFKKFCIGK